MGVQVTAAEVKAMSGLRTYKLELELDSDSQAAAKARRALLGFTDALSIDTYLDLRLVTSELVSNSVKYGPGHPVTMSVTMSRDGVVTGRVSDGGRAGVQVGQADPETGVGLGLVILDSLAAAWGVEPDSTTVWFELKPETRQQIAGPAAAAAPERTLAQVEHEIAEELLRLHSESYGTGAATVEVLISESAVVVFLDDLELQPNEGYLVDAGRGDAVIETRRVFQQAIESTFRASIERIIGREVASFASITKLNPNFECEIFRLAPRRQRLRA